MAPRVGDPAGRNVAGMTTTLITGAGTVRRTTGLDVLVNNAGIQVEMDSAGVASGAAELTADLMARTLADDTLPW